MEVKDAKNQSAKAPCGAYRSTIKKETSENSSYKRAGSEAVFLLENDLLTAGKNRNFTTYTLVDLIVANEEHVKKISKGKLQTVTGKKLSYSRTRRQKAPEKTCCYRKWTGGPVLRVFTCL